MVPAEDVACNTGGSDRVIQQDAVQPFISVTTTQYIPAANPDTDEVIDPLLHKYV